jgi:hypothetical protein
MGREQRKQNQATKKNKTAVVKDESSAKELVDRVSKAIPDAKVKARKGKRKSYGEDYDVMHTTGGQYGLAMKVAGVAAVAGLAYLGLKKNGESMTKPPSAPMPASNTSSRQNTIGFAKPFSTGPTNTWGVGGGLGGNMSGGGF